MIGLLAGLLAFIEDESKRKDIQAIIDFWKNASTEVRFSTIRFRVVKTYDTNFKKRVLAWGPGQQAQNMRATFTTILSEQKNVSYKMGRPPAGYMEREIALWLKELMK